MTEAFKDDSNNYWWTEDAACNGHAINSVSNVFFGKDNEKPQKRKKREEIARKICESCVVIDVCRAHVSEKAETGFWAGLNIEQRYELGMPLQTQDVIIAKRRIAAERRVGGV